MDQTIAGVLWRITYVLLFAAIIWKQWKLDDRIRQAEKGVLSNLENLEELVRVLKEKAKKA